MSVKSHYKLVCENIKTAYKDAKRQDKEPVLAVVTKNFPLDDVMPLIEVGHKVFGENKVQEAEQKWAEIKKQKPDLELHLIGPLQTNKIKEALGLFDVIQTIDREKLADKIAEELKKAEYGDKKFFIQVNTGSEEQKAGILPKDADAFIDYCKKLGLNIVGLMCIPPVEDEPSPHFALLKKIAKKHSLKELSMGMSDDYEIAVQLGASLVRVGSAIMGSRA